MTLFASRSRTAAQVAATLSGHAEGTGYLCRCPVPTHGKGRGDLRPSLGVSDGRKGVVFHCFAGCTHEQVSAALDGRPSAPPPASAAPIGRVKPKTTSDFARKLWRASQPVAGTLAETYLRSRGFIEPPAATIRFLPRYRYNSTRQYPCLIAAVQEPSREIAAVQLTFLGPGGHKAPVPYPRRAIGPYDDGMLRLSPVGPELGIAEGFETAWAASLIHKFPVWATLSAERFSIVTIPPEVRRLIIFADNDPPGLAAASGLQSARPDLDVLILTPPQEGDDFADVWYRSIGVSCSKLLDGSSK